jgi:hypothetical protein
MYYQYGKVMAGGISQRKRIRRGVSMANVAKARHLAIQWPGQSKMWPGNEISMAKKYQWLI